MSSYAYVDDALPMVRSLSRARRSRNEGLVDWLMILTIIYVHKAPISLLVYCVQASIGNLATDVAIGDGHSSIHCRGVRRGVHILT